MGYLVEKLFDGEMDSEITHVCFNTIIDSYIDWNKKGETVLDFVHFERIYVSVYLYIEHNDYIFIWSMVYVIVWIFLVI